MINRILIDRNIMHGKPCIKGTRIPVYLILDLLAGGSTIKEILDDYPDITEEDIRACVEYAAMLAREEAGELEPAA
ncbi:MAG: antitoxin [Nitrospirae bacterium CG_4_10_14_3_um_filter_44_29]|nr:DUF433 domain-containing protein [Nitrospirota bacterium]PIP70097.1 MAG: antitoxin [Nitrospirae bacterium CG22_combo_CG10-13_8_21_14_all_44_11]PIV40578.1 MAG: antitoxin [Nitrospirae bacterium CG02_land_8_20_14_3_00_44_33]PIV65400.1 MAG: antitoxin [Nitrospirae bacterium CG01_land_8_20_14_3_00_44_22]PIW89359.1 MAG: antitoxin [Nitrospirae bacterium CG_4_8_14_3_um_filter_44_28]PIX87639.1 MAG: antitoxin [Nitrospirae bacterium CG_4_10_14_3_um_filter_44_29]PJA81650.1 MAG: antitoxin [Nitrospirae b